jgi:hypothetical protein
MTVRIASVRELRTRLADLPAPGSFSDELESLPTRCATTSRKPSRPARHWPPRRAFGWSARSSSEGDGCRFVPGRSRPPPLLSAVVVRKDEALPIPGPGFYRLAKELGSMSKGEDKVVFWKAEFRRVCTYAWK